MTIDLDLFQSAHQLAVSKPILRDPRFGQVLRDAKVRMFVLSPSYTGGGTTKATFAPGSPSSSLRLLNLIRAARGDDAPSAR